MRNLRREWLMVLVTWAICGTLFAILAQAQIPEHKLTLTGYLWAVPQESKAEFDWKFFTDPIGESETIILETNQDPDSINRTWLNGVAKNGGKVEITIRVLPKE